MNNDSYQTTVDRITELLKTIEKIQDILNTYCSQNELEPLEAKKIEVRLSDDLLEQSHLYIEVSNSLKIKSKLLSSNISQLKENSFLLRKKSRLLRKKFSGR